MSPFQAETFSRFFLSKQQLLVHIPRRNLKKSILTLHPTVQASNIATVFYRNRFRKNLDALELPWQPLNKSKFTRGIFRGPEVNNKRTEEIGFSSLKPSPAGFKLPNYNPLLPPKRRVHVIKPSLFRFEDLGRREKQSCYEKEKRNVFLLNPRGVIIAKLRNSHSPSASPTTFISPPLNFKGVFSLILHLYSPRSVFIFFIQTFIHCQSLYLELTQKVFKLKSSGGTSKGDTDRYFPTILNFHDVTPKRDGPNS